MDEFKFIRNPAFRQAFEELLRDGLIEKEVVQGPVVCYGLTEKGRQWYEKEVKPQFEGRSKRDSA